MLGLFAVFSSIWAFITTGRENNTTKNAAFFIKILIFYNLIITSVSKQLPVRIFRES
jgi:hypothetical protein